MAQNLSDVSPERQVEAAGKAFEQEFGRFARFTGASPDFTGLDLDAALAEERALAEVRTRHLGKKSELAAARKLIGRLTLQERASFARLVQATEAEILRELTQVEFWLKQFIEQE